MNWNTQAGRRWFGAICLAVAIGLVLCGETVFKERLDGLNFVAYWLVCFGFTGLAMCAAFLDLRALGRQTRDDQRALFESTLRQIEHEKRSGQPADRQNRAR